MYSLEKMAIHFLWHFKFTYFYLFLACWVVVAARGPSLVEASGGHSLLRCVGLSLRWLLLLWNTGSRAQDQQLWGTGLDAPRHVGSSQMRAQTHVPCIGRWTPNHCATREAPYGILKSDYFVWI